jgi:hypothetical protein
MQQSDQRLFSSTTDGIDSYSHLIIGRQINPPTKQRYQPRAVPPPINVLNHHSRICFASYASAQQTTDKDARHQNPTVKSIRPLALRNEMFNEITARNFPP